LPDFLPIYELATFAYFILSVFIFVAFLYLILSSFSISLSCPFLPFLNQPCLFSTLHPAPPIISILSAPVFDGAFTVFQILFFKLLCSFCPGCEEDPVHADAECTILARGPRPYFRREEDFGGKNREEKADESDASATAASDASATAYHAILPLRLLLLQDRERREST
jgi:hypothetical protein